jgi:hypothetical protein
MKKVVHCKIDKFDVYIGRPSIWGNPFSHKDGTQALFKVESSEEAVAKFKEYLKSNKMLMSKIHELDNKILACWCKTSKNPNAPCHGDAIIEVLEEIKSANKNP